MSLPPFCIHPFDTFSYSLKPQSNYSPLFSITLTEKAACVGNRPFFLFPKAAIANQSSDWCDNPYLAPLCKGCCRAYARLGECRPSDNPSVNASRCHLPLHRGGLGYGFPVAVPKILQRHLAAEILTAVTHSLCFLCRRRRTASLLGMTGYAGAVTPPWWPAPPWRSRRRRSGRCSAPRPASCPPRPPPPAWSPGTCAGCSWSFAA